MSKLIRSNGNKAKAVIITILVLLLLIVVGFIAYAKVQSQSDKIYKGVKINNLSLSLEGLTKEDALNEIRTFQKLLNERNYTFSYSENKIDFKGEELDIKIDEKIVDKAYDAGRGEGEFFAPIKSLFGNEIANLDANISLDEEALKSIVEKLLENFGSEAVNSTYSVSDDSILIKKGESGVKPNFEHARDALIKEAGLQENNGIVVEAKIVEAADVNFDALYDQVFVAKKDASYNSKGEYTQEQVGVSFDKDAAKSQYNHLNPGDEMKVELIKAYPEVTTENLNDVLFPDVLASFQTKYNAANTNRSTNLEKASKSFNGMILVPGQEFSYNKALGERTAANGWKEAHVYSGGEVVDGLGGGICQISSTLYNAVLLADLEVTNRKGHMFWPEYVDPSFDATVVWGSIDFKFKNSRETPIKLFAEAKAGIATVKIYGKKTDKDPIIELYCNKISTKPYNTITRNDPTLEKGKQVTTQTPVIGYVSEGYKIYKDASGKEIERKLISKDTYSATDRIVKVGTKDTTTTTPKDPNTEVLPVVEVPATTTPTPTQKPTTTTTPAPKESATPSDTTTAPSTSTQWPTGWDTPENPNFKG